jgi:PHD/YefM family antitoxin component YafN of YafNO toxin-antitoxin module
MEMMNEQYVVDTKGKKVSVILSLDRYERLIEDLHDLAIIAQRRDEQPISFDEMKRLERARTR